MAETKANVLMEVAAGHVPAVAAALREVPGLGSVEAVMGPYDIILSCSWIAWPARMTSSASTCTASAGWSAP